MGIDIEDDVRELGNELQAVQANILNEIETIRCMVRDLSKRLDGIEGIEETIHNLECHAAWEKGYLKGRAGLY